ncbi:MAG: glycogen/starch synthase [Candidatus Margulisiibacteriota bacterium]
MIDVSGNNVHPTRLRVTFVAERAHPFAPGGETDRLSEAAGKVPSALPGINAQLILPYIDQTEKDVKRVGLYDSLTKLPPLEVAIGAKIIHSEISTLYSPLNPGYPVYFIDQRQQANTGDIEGVAAFNLAAVALIERSGPSPDIVQLMGPFSALAGVYIWDQKNSYGIPDVGSNYYLNTWTVFAVDTLRNAGSAEFDASRLPEIGLQWGGKIPSWLLFKLKLNLIKAGLKAANITCTWGYDDIIAAANDDAHFAAILKERKSTGALVGLFPGNSSRSTADEAARRFLGIYRSLECNPLGRPRGSFEAAQQTTPSLPWELLPLEKLRANAELGKFIDSISAEDVSLLEKEASVSGEDRFKNVRTLDDVNALLKFLRTGPICKFESGMREKGLGVFIDPFYAGDLDRLLSAEFELTDCSEPRVLKAFEGQQRTTIYQAMKILGVIDHVARLLERLQFISSVENREYVDLVEILSTRGDPELTGEVGLKEAATDYRLLLAIYNTIKFNPRLFMCFALGTILHDVGKCLRHDMHPLKGVEILKSIKAVGFLFTKEEIDFIGKIILYHSTFGDSAITKEVSTKYIENLYSAYADPRKRSNLLDCLFLLGVADMDGGREKSLLSFYKLRLFHKVYDKVIGASDPEDLKEILKELGLEIKSWGINRWKHFAAGKVVIEKNGDRSKIDQDEAVAEQELAEHCKTSKKNISDFYEYLGFLDRMYGLEDAVKEIDDPKMRARLLIHLVELMRFIHDNNTHFDSFKLVNFSKDDIGRLTAAMENENITLPNIAGVIDYTYDEESELVEISIK